MTVNGTYPNQKLLGMMLVAVPLNARDETTTMGDFQVYNKDNSCVLWRMCMYMYICSWGYIVHLTKFN